MRCLLQRVSSASVSIDDVTVSKIENGLLILVCAMDGDTTENCDAMVRKVIALRIFKDAEGRMNRSLKDTGGAALIVSQFTLAADTSRGNRPGFGPAADPKTGEQLYDYFCIALAAQGIATQTGRFGADMQVALVNDGPVTIWLDK